MSKIHYQSSSSKLVVVAVVGLALIGAGAYWLTSGSASSSEEGGAAQSASSGLPGWPQATSADAGGGELPQPATLPDGRPGDVAADDWEALKAALAKVGMPAEEAQRIVTFNRYQRNFESWQTLDESDDAARRRRVAQALMNELPSQVQRGNFTLLESVMIGAALIAEIETDPARRTARLESWQNDVLTVMPVQSEDQGESKDTTREIELKRRQAIAFSEWQARTDPVERSPVRLEQALEEVRRAYNARAF